MTRLTTRCIGLALVLLLLTSAVALAGTFEGPGRDDPKVGVSFEKERGLIKRFTIEKAKFSCADGHVFRSSTHVGRMDLRRTKSGDRKFSGYFSNADGSQSARVHGRFASRRNVTGTFRLIAVFETGGCDTGRVDWQARATPG